MNIFKAAFMHFTDYRKARLQKQIDCHTNAADRISSAYSELSVRDQLQQMKHRELAEIFSKKLKRMK
ncbi:MAG: hypothetical protein FWE17_00395 [Alphaproteobacteria bacterium]|nr:hypothetical protein [Alphaproteobacteria bacterium]MCL2758507.1 hypothetical protein [Alphaproteobacteria bacterium]